MKRRYAMLAASLAVFLMAPENLLASPQSGSILKNGSFEKWDGKVPVDWKIEVGIFNGGSEPVSKVTKSENDGIELSGNKRTLAWNSVSQTIEMEPGKIYKLTFNAKAQGLKREVNQFDNCYVGFWFKNAAGKYVGNQVEKIDSRKFQEFEIKVVAPEGVKQADVSLTLSKTGRLFVKNMKLIAVSDEDSFEYLVETMKEQYSYFEHKKIDFDALAKRYRDKAKAAKDEHKFVEIIHKMLAELKDGHVWIKHAGQHMSPWSPPFQPNYRFDVVAKDFKFSKQIGKFALTAQTKDGLGYVRIDSLSGISSSDVKELQQAIGKLLETPGMIIDLRSNGGGDEPTAQSIASLFADKEYVYAKQKVRKGDGFTKVYSRRLAPAKGNAYAKPMVCLVGPRAMSSAEGFAMMFKALDHCQLVGQPTRGSSGNPGAVTLPNGVEVWFSRWVAMEVDETPIEGRGVMPDIKIEHDENQAQDPTYFKAVELLTRK